MACIQSDPIRTAEGAREVIRAVDMHNPIVASMLEIMACSGLRFVDASQLTFEQFEINGVYRGTVQVVQQKTLNHMLTKGRAKLEERREALKVMADSLTPSMLKSETKRLQEDEKRMESRAKGKAMITIQVTPQICEVIDDVKRLQGKDSGLMFANTQTGKPYTAQYVNKILKAVARDQRLPFQLSTHSFRKTFALMIVNAGGTVQNVRDLLGHASLSSTDHYLSTFISDKQKLVSAIAF